MCGGSLKELVPVQRYEILANFHGGCRHSFMCVLDFYALIQEGELLLWMQSVRSAGRVRNALA